MVTPIPGYLTAQQAADHLGITLQAVYNLNSRNNDFPAPVYVGRTPLWPADQIDTWRAAHPARGKQ